MRLLLLSLFLVGCSTVKPTAPIIIENNEKDEYIKKVEQTVSETTSALVAVVPQVPSGISRELVQNQIDRLSTIGKPSVSSVEVFKKIVLSKDEKALQAQDSKADKADAELIKLRASSEQKDKELTAEKAVRADTEARLQRESKDKILWMISCVGLAVATGGLLIVVFTPFKAKGGMLIAGGSLAVSSAWILDSKWFTIILFSAIAIIIADCLIMFVAWTHDKWVSQSSRTQ